MFEVSGEDRTGDPSGLFAQPSVFFVIQKHTYLPPPECAPSVFDDDVFYSHTAPLEESVAACALVSCGTDVDDWLQGLKRLRPTLHGFIQVYPFIL